MSFFQVIPVPKFCAADAVKLMLPLRKKDKNNCPIRQSVIDALDYAQKEGLEYPSFYASLHPDTARVIYEIILRQRDSVLNDVERVSINSHLRGSIFCYSTIESNRIAEYNLTRLTVLKYYTLRNKILMEVATERGLNYFNEEEHMWLEPTLPRAWRKTDFTKEHDVASLLMLNNCKPESDFATTVEILFDTLICSQLGKSSDLLKRIMFAVKLIEDGVSHLYDVSGYIGKHEHMVTVNVVDRTLYTRMFGDYIESTLAVLYDLEHIGGMGCRTRLAIYNILSSFFPLELEYLETLETNTKPDQ